MTGVLLTGGIGFQMKKRAGVGQQSEALKMNGRVIIAAQECARSENVARWQWGVYSFFQANPLAEGVPEAAKSLAVP